MTASVHEQAISQIDGLDRENKKFEEVQRNLVMAARQAFERQKAGDVAVTDMEARLAAENERLEATSCQLRHAQWEIAQVTCRGGRWHVVSRGRVHRGGSRACSRHLRLFFFLFSPRPAATLPHPPTPFQNLSQTPL